MNKKFFYKTISQVLIITLLLTIFPMSLLAKADSSDSSKSKQKTVVKELVEKRTEYQKEFLNTDGTHSIKYYDTPIHYKNGDKYEDIDNTLVSNSDERTKDRYDLTNKANKFKTIFSSIKDKKDFMGISLDKYYMEMVPEDAVKNDAVIKEKSITYPNVYENIDLLYDSSNNGVKESIIVNKPTQKTAYTFKLVLDNLVPVKNNDGTISLNDSKSGDKIWLIPLPYADDAKGEFCGDVTQNIRNENGKYYIDIKIDSIWLNSPERQYPVVIDPSTYSYDDTGNSYDTFVMSAYPNNKYYSQGDWRVGNSSSTGTCRTFIKVQNLPSFDGAINYAYFWSYCLSSYSGSPAVEAWEVTSPWSETSVDWYHQPSYANCFDTTLVSGSGWYAWNISFPCIAWRLGRANNGIMLKMNDSDNSAGYYRRFYDNKTYEHGNCHYIEINYTPLSTPSLSASPAGSYKNTSAGNMTVSWNPVSPYSRLDFAGYYVSIYNGHDYQDFYAGNSTSWSSAGKGIYPTGVNLGAWRFKTDGTGTDLSCDPRNLYTNAWNANTASENTDYRNNLYYAVRVRSLQTFTFGGTTYSYVSNFSDANIITLPDTIPPNSVPNVGLSLSDSGLNTGDSWKATATWGVPTDLPQGGASGIGSYLVRLNNTTTKATKDVRLQSNQTSYTFTGLEDCCSYKAEVYTYDVNGNGTNVPSSSSELYAADRTGPNAPTSVTVSPSTWTNNTSPNVTVSWASTFDQSGFKKSQYSIDGGSWVDTGLTIINGTFSVPCAALTDGNHTIAVRGVDPQGNTGAISSTYYYKDTIMPTANIVNPLNQQAVNGIVNITGNVDDTHLSNWTLSYGQGTSPATYTLLTSGTSRVVNSLLYSWNVSSLSEGTYTLKLTVTDSANNTRNVTTQIIKSANSISANPGIQIDAPQNGTTISSQYNTVLYQLINNGGKSGLLGKLYINSTLVGQESSAGEGLNFDVANFAEGSIKDMFVKATDNSGNTLYSTTTYKGTPVADTFTDITKIENMIDVERSASDSIRLKLNGSTYPVSGSFMSKAISMPGNLDTIKITATEEKPAGTNITYEVTSDGGTTWQNVAVNTITELNKKGNSLKIKVNLTTTNSSVTPQVYDWQVDTVSVAPGSVFTVQLIDVPKNLTATPNINYNILLRWDESQTLYIYYNIYRSTDQNFTPSQQNLVASNITTPYWNDFNLNYGKTFYYKVCAASSLYSFNGNPRESLPSNIASARVVDADELDKRLGIEDFWGLAQVQAGSGTGYINLSTGNLCYQSTDFVYPGTKLATVMRRSYNNQSTTKTPLGYGWDFSFNTNLLKEYDTYGNEVGMILKDGDGSIHRFSRNADGKYNPPKGVYMELTYDITYGRYEIKRKDNITYIFNDKMQLLQFVEPNGNAISLTYDNRGRIETVKNSVDDVTYLSYDKEDRLNKITDPSGRVFTYEYDLNSGWLARMYITVEDNVECSERYIYDDSLNITAITDPQKNTTSFAYVDNKISGTTNAIGQTYNIGYLQDNTSSITYKGKAVSFGYNTDGSITKKTDQNGHSINYECDSNCNVIRMYYQNIVDGEEKTIEYTYTYDSRGNLLTITDPLHTTTYKYDDNDEFNEVKEIIKPVQPGVEDSITEYEYDEDGNLTSSTVWSYKKVEPSTYTKINTTKYTYRSDGNIESITDNFGNTTTYNYDSNKGRLIKKIEPLGKVTEILEYDAQGNPVKVKDALGNVTQYKYDILGRKVTIIYPGSPEESDTKVESFVYDLNGNLKSSTDRKNNTTKFDYDPLNRLITTTYQDGSTTSINYSSGIDNNKIVTYKDGENRESTEYYDAVGRIIKKEAGGTFTTYEYDYIGNVTKVKDAEGRESTAAYDELGRTKKTVIDPISENHNGNNIVNEFTYDLLGNKLTSTDGEGNITSYSYDVMGRLLTVSNNVSKETIKTSYQYDIKVEKGDKYYLKEGDEYYIINKVTDALGREKWTYFDALGRKVRDVNEGDPNDSIREITQYQYDLNGNLLHLTKNDSSVIGYEYDNYDRLTKVQYEPNNYTSYTYDGNGNRLSMTDVKDGNSIITSYAYNMLNQLTQAVQDQNATNYDYDKSGNLARIYYSEGDNIKNIVYKYDQYNRIQSIGVGYGINGTDNYSTIRDYSYTQSGYVDSVKDHRQFDTNGGAFTEIKYTYNTAGQLEITQYLDNGTTEKEKYTIQYDKRGLIKDETSCTNYDIAKTIKKTYSYDELGRLLSMNNTSESKTDTYIYDGVGNRTEMTDGTDHYDYSYNQFNQLQTIMKNDQIDSSFQYDLNGNQKQEVSNKNVNGVVKSVTTNYNYDWADRLTNISVSDGTNTSNTTNYYNGDGKRIRRDVDGIVTKYYYEGDSTLYTTDNNNVKCEENVLDLNGVTIASKRFDGIYSNMYFFYNYDIRGSVTNILNPDGTVVKGYNYDEFGDTKETGDSQFKNDTKFTGAVHDQSSNLYLMGDRFYNPTTGRFLTQDTYSGNPYDQWTQHLYIYCGGNPVSMIDPTGHRFQSANDKDDSCIHNTSSTKTTQRSRALIKKNTEGSSSSNSNVPQAKQEIDPVKLIPLVGANCLIIGIMGTLVEMGCHDNATKSMVATGTVATVEGINVLSNKVTEDIGTGIKNLAEETGKAGQDIVGSTFNEIGPTQTEVNAERVQYYANKLMAGEKVDPIEVVNVEGRGRYILDGTHRFVASELTGIPVQINEIYGAGPIGMSDWSSTEWVGWDGYDWIY